jgi:rubrerythrin
MTVQDPDLLSYRIGGEEWRPPHEPDRDFDLGILYMLRNHGAREGAALEAYRRVLDESSANEGVRYLIRLILDDEHRHHQVFAEMANALQSFIEELSVEPQVPGLAPERDPALLDVTRRLLALEKEDAKELRQLRKSLRGAPKSMLHPLLVDLMRHDTAKHIAILEHIVTRLSGR